MKKSIIAQIIVSLFAVFPLSAQVNLTGKVTDAENGASLADVIVMVTSHQKTILKHTQTQGDGTFEMSIPTLPDSCSLSFRLMGYESQTYPLTEGRSRQFTVRMQATSIKIKEVLVKAPRMRAQGDTLVYNVASFANEQDRSIGDVLKKMPGILVSEEGKVSYNGTDINRFYIEGKDLLEGRYGIATKGISPKDVGRVEVMENHQPVRVMEGLAFSDKAAINLVLKEGAKYKLMGNFGVKGGLAEQDKSALWNAALFGMLIGKNTQNITTLKSNNTGENINRDIRQYYTDMQSDEQGTESYLQVGVGALSDLKEKRVLFNRSHLLSSSQLWSVGKKLQLKAQVDLLDSRVTNDMSVNSLYYLPESNKLIVEDKDARSRRRELNARFILDGNNPRTYLKQTLNTGFTWNDTDQQTLGTTPNRQSAKLRTAKVESNLYWMQRFGEKLVTFTADNRFNHAPQQLDVVQDGAVIRQRIDVNRFYSREEVGYNLTLGEFVFSLKSGFGGLVRAMDSRLTGLPDSIGKLTNNITTHYWRIYATPGVQYSAYGWNFTIDAPLSYYQYYLGASFPKSRKITFSPRFHAKWDATSHLSLSASGQIAPGSIDVNAFYDGLILTNYRTLRQGITGDATPLGQSVTGSLQYKQVRHELFANLTLLRSWNSTPYRQAQLFVGEYMLNAYKAQRLFSDSWLVTGSVSKGITPIKGIVILSGSLLRSGSSLLTEGVPMRYHYTVGSGNMEVNGSLSTWLRWLYKLNYGISTLSSQARLSETLDSWYQLLKLDVLPYRKGTLTWLGEYYRNEVTQGSYKSLLLMDVVFTHRLGNFELSLTANNLLNRASYAYNRQSDLSSVAYRQQIRGREFLLGVRWVK